MPHNTATARRTSVHAYLANKILQRATIGVECGQLVIVTPANQTHVFGRQGVEPRATLHIHDWKLVRRLVTGWDVGFAESYMAGEWSSPDLPSLLNLMCRNTRMGVSTRALGTLRSLTRLRHVLNRNSRNGSRRNIAAHYDLGNKFYGHWLDDGMTYSSALYSDRTQSLEDAQEAKLNRIMELLDLSDGQSVLEIGCGWGGLAERVLEHKDCSITGLTLSTEQLRFAEERLGRQGKSAQSKIKLRDYRDEHGKYDHIVSIEMLEAVGETYWPVYFSKLREQLNESGTAVLQVITIGEEHFETYRRYPDFIQRYIFPGGMLPTVDAIKTQVERAGLKLVSTEFFGQSYAWTLAEWRKRFKQSWHEIQPLGFDARFYRMWDYYLAYCQAGFEAGAVNVGLYKISHPQ
jgi:cyclopropane-fatty-acyl-phospholipid synthase